ncbi:MAG: DUF1934 domain-containing protein [Acetivibrio sp.]
MDKDVLVSISGLQFEMDQEETMEVISPGEYYFKNGKHYVFFEEMTELDEYNRGLSKNRLKIGSGQIELQKKGYSNTTLLFEKDKKNMTYYRTPYGELLVGIHTTDIKVEEHEEELLVTIAYSLDLNYEHVSNCTIIIKIVDRK